MHEGAGGIGQDEIADLVNIDRLVLLANCLNQKGEMHTIMQGAVERLQEYANISTNPLNTDVTQYIDAPNGMWLFQLKQWMEKHDIKIQTDTAYITAPCIMDMCKRKTQQGETWRWVKANNLKHITDMVYPDGTIREIIFDTHPQIRSSIITQTSKWRMENLRQTRPTCGELNPGRWVKNKTGQVGEIKTNISTATKECWWTYTQRKEDTTHGMIPRSTGHQKIV